MKIFKYILKWAVWSVVVLIVSFASIPRIPYVQTWLGDKTEIVLGQLLGTEVRVGKIDVGFFMRVIIDDVLIKDQQKKDMLKVNRLSARLDPFALAEGRVSISSAQLFGAQAILYRTDSLTKPNFHFVIDSLSSTDTLSHHPLDVQVNSLIVRHSSVRFDQQDAETTPGCFNTQHLYFNDVSAHIILKRLTEDSLNINVKRLALNEHSGLNLNRLSFRIEAGKTKAELTDFLLRMPSTQFKIEHLLATYDSQHLEETLSLDTEVDDAEITPSDFACFLPALSSYTVPITFNTALSGPLQELSISNLHLLSENEEFELDTKGWISLSSPLAWQLQLNRLAMGPSLLEQLPHDIPDLPGQVSQLKHLDVSGFSDRSRDGDLKVVGQLDSDLGRIDVSVGATGDQHFSGLLKTDNFLLQPLFSNLSIGKIATQIEVAGTPSAMKATGLVNMVEVKDYPYKNIQIEGMLKGNTIVGNVSIDDPNCKIDLEGQWKKEQRDMALRLTGYMHHVAPSALHLTDRWGSATFSTIIDADIQGSCLNDAEGSIDIDDFEMIDSIGKFVVDNVHVKSGYEGEKHVLKIDGDLGEAELKGKFDWSTLSQSFINYVAAKLPTLPGLPPSTNVVNNDFDFVLRMPNTRWMQRLLGVPLKLEKPLLLQASVNDNTHEIDVRGQIPAFSYNADHYQGGRIQITSPGDSMKCNVLLTKQADDGDNLDLRLVIAAADNNLQASVEWDNHDEAVEAMRGQLNAVAQLYQGRQGKPEAHITLTPSSMVVAGAEWEIKSNDIFYSTNSLSIDQFTLQHGQQHLIINGKATENRDDTLSVDLSDVEVAYVLGLVDFDAVEFSGGATGTVSLAGLFDTPAAWCDLNITNFRFEKGRMGTLTAHAQWNEEKQQIDITAMANDGPDAITDISGFVSPGREEIDLNIAGRGTYVEFVNSFTESFLSDVTGHAHGAVRLSGPLSEMNLTGALAIDGEATVTSLGTTYRLMGDTVRFVPDDIRLDKVRLQDRYGNTAYLSGGIHHEHLTSLSFDLDVNTSRLLAYDFTEYGDMSFFGTVFANGKVELQGRPGEVNINCDVTPLQGTTFHYNVASGDAISSQEFITWHDVGKKTVVVQRKQHKKEEEEDDLPTDIYIDFKVNTTADSEVRLLMDEKTNDYITLYGSGVITAKFHNKGDFTMNGTYTVERGTYGITIQNIIKKNFNFGQGGTVAFRGAPFDAALDLKAVYTVNSVPLSDLNIGNSFSSNNIRVDCLMDITGTAGEPHVGFDLDMPTVNSEEKQMIRSLISTDQEINQQVLYLLGIGRFYTQGANNATTQQYDQTTLAMQSFLSGTVSTQISEVISQFVKSNDWTFGANISTGNEGWHDAAYEGLVSGRMLNNRLLINGQFGYRDNATQATPSFIGDFDIRYLLFPSGNLALKVYNQTNDRYFTRSSLNTQGVGLIMKKDFNSLGDLFGIRRKAKSTPQP